MKITVTEALQELKTIASRINKKQDSIGNYIARDSRILDPLEKTGGSADFISKERQSIGDLRARLIKIRSSIQAKNLSSELTIQGYTRTVSDWLTWRREVSEGEKNFITAMLASIRKIRGEVQKVGGSVSRTASVTPDFNNQTPPNIVVNVDELELMHQQEKLETILGELDGKLSLFNATSVIDI